MGHRRPASQYCLAQEFPAGSDWLCRSYVRFRRFVSGDTACQSIGLCSGTSSSPKTSSSRKTFPPFERVSLRWGESRKYRHFGYRQGMDRQGMDGQTTRSVRRGWSVRSNRSCREGRHRDSSSPESALAGNAPWNLDTILPNDNWVTYVDVVEVPLGILSAQPYTAMAAVLMTHLIDGPRS